MMTPLSLHSPGPPRLGPKVPNRATLPADTRVAQLLAGPGSRAACGGHGSGAGVVKCDTTPNDVSEATTPAAQPMMRSPTVAPTDASTTRSPRTARLARSEQAPTSSAYSAPTLAGWCSRCVIDPDLALSAQSRRYGWPSGFWRSRSDGAGMVVMRCCSSRGRQSVRRHAGQRAGKCPSSQMPPLGAGRGRGCSGCLPCVR